MVILSELCVVIISSGGGKWLANAVKQTLFWIRAGQNNLEALYFLVSNLPLLFSRVRSGNGLFVWDVFFSTFTP